MDNLLFVRNYERMLFLGERIQSFRTFSAFIGDVRFRLHRTGSRIDGITHAGSAGPQVVRIYRQRIGYGKPNAVGRRERPDFAVGGHVSRNIFAAARMVFHVDFGRSIFGERVAYACCPEAGQLSPPAYLTDTTLSPSI